MMKQNKTTMGLVRAVIICAVLGLTTRKPSGVLATATRDDMIFKAVGETALFNTSRDLAPYKSLSWKEKLSFKTIITVSSTGFGNYTNPKYANRITLFPNGSLELRNLTLEDFGQYAVTIKLTEGPQIDMEFYLYMDEPISDVRLSVSATDLIEDKSSVNFTCSAASGTSRFLYWYNSSRYIGSDSEFTLTNVRRYDTGPFTCDVGNWISDVSSEVVILTISYGPDVDVKAVPQRDNYYKGGDVTLHCTVDSKPEAEITWFYNGDELPVAGAELKLKNLTEEQGGNYHCEAFNNITMLHKTSPPVTIAVVNRPNHLSDGAIAGISIAVIAVVLGLTALMYYGNKRNRR